MSARLLINDGSPWWESPNIWMVPGADPNGLPGSPIVGVPAYLWARVSNTGNIAAMNCRIDFYWANPSAQMVVGVATLIGSAYTNLNPGDIQDVLCLVPWVPVIVNGGHECVLAVVHGPGDSNPIPDPLPNGYAFDPPVHDQIAQLNLSVLQASMIQMPMTLYVNAIGRVDKEAVLAVEYSREINEHVLSNLGVRGLKPASEHHVDAILSLQARCEYDQHGAREMKVHVKRGTTVPIFLTMRPQRLPRGSYEVVRVVERIDGKLAGGVSFLIANDFDEETSTRGQKS